MDYFATEQRFNTLSLPDLLRARDQFHPHLLHKANVVGTAIGRYLIRKDEPYPKRTAEPESKPRKSKGPRTLENSEVREYSWPAVLVFVSEWADKKEFGGSGNLTAFDYIPPTIFLEDGRSVPICVVEAPRVESLSPLAAKKLTFPEDEIAGGYPITSVVQQVERSASIGCLVTDGHRVYALTNRHVTGSAGEALYATKEGEKVKVGISSDKQIGRIAFEKLYDSWPGKKIYVNLDVGLIEIEDQKIWNPSVYGVGALGPLADLSVFNLTLNLIGCPVRAHGAASGRLFGRIAALFYRYKSVGGFEYVADFLIGSRDDKPLETRPGDSGTVWVVETDNVDQDLMPLAVQWGGTVFESGAEQLPFALATNLSNVCRELEVELFRSRELAAFEYWEAVGHYTVSSLACTQPGDPNLKTLMMANQTIVGFAPGDINRSVNTVTVPGFVPLANVPDKVWKKWFNETTAPYGRKGPENPNHYADIDFPPDGSGPTLSDLTPDESALDPQVWRDYYDSIGWTSVSERGLLPFRVWQIYNKMVDYVRSRDVDLYVTAAGVLAHYVGDACQTLHGSYLSDGDPFRFPDGSPSADMLGHGKGFAAGIHGAYEGDMLDRHYGDLIPGLQTTLGASHGMTLVDSGRKAGYAVIELIRRVQTLIPPMVLVNSYGAILAAGRKSEARDLLWTEFGAATIAVVAEGCRTLAMIWESAWVEGNGGNIPLADLKLQSRTAIKKIYNRQSFLRSVALGPVKVGQKKIDEYL